MSESEQRKMVAFLIEKYQNFIYKLRKIHLPADVLTLLLGAAYQKMIKMSPGTSGSLFFPRIIALKKDYPETCNIVYEIVLANKTNGTNEKKDIWIEWSKTIWQLCEAFILMRSSEDKDYLITTNQKENAAKQLIEWVQENEADAILFLRYFDLFFKATEGDYGPPKMELVEYK